MYGRVTSHLEWCRRKDGGGPRLQKDGWGSYPVGVQVTKLKSKAKSERERYVEENTGRRGRGTSVRVRPRGHDGREESCSGWMIFGDQSGRTHNKVYWNIPVDWRKVVFGGWYPCGCESRDAL